MEELKQIGSFRYLGYKDLEPFINKNVKLNQITNEDIRIKKVNKQT